MDSNQELNPLVCPLDGPLTTEFEIEFPELAQALREVGPTRDPFQMARDRGFVLMLPPVPCSADPERLTCPVCSQTWLALFNPDDSLVESFAACPFGCNVRRVPASATDDQILAVIQAAQASKEAQK